VKCRDWQERIDPYLDGELASEEVLGLEEHLSACHKCAEGLEEAQRLASAIAGMARAKPPEGLLAAIFGQVEAAAALDCESVRPELVALADGEVEPARQLPVRVHVEGCPTCGAVLAEMTAMREATRRSLVRVRAPRGLVGAILAATTRPRQADWFGPVFAPRRVGYALAAVTAAAAVTALFLYLPEGMRTSPSPSVASAPQIEQPGRLVGPVSSLTPLEEGIGSPAESTGPEKGSTAGLPGAESFRSAVRSLSGRASARSGGERISAASKTSHQGRLEEEGRLREAGGLPAARTEGMAAPAAGDAGLPALAPELEGSGGAEPAPVISVAARADFEVAAPGESSAGLLGGESARPKASPASTKATGPVLLRVRF